jgi:hypothetical protein
VLGGVVLRFLSYTTGAASHANAALLRIAPRKPERRIPRGPPMSDARTVLKEWFQSGKNRRLSLAEMKMLQAINGPDYLRLYAEVEREVTAEKAARAP